MKETIERIQRADGERAIEIHRSASELFSYSELQRIVDVEPELSDEPFEYETPIYDSGLFDSAERAREDARKRYAWLRPS